MSKIGTSGASCRKKEKKREKENGQKERGDKVFFSTSCSLFKKENNTNFFSLNQSINKCISYLFIFSLFSLSRCLLSDK